jgi:hypothetical protein
MAGFALSMYRECKYAFFIVAIAALPLRAAQGPFTLERFEGDVQVRQGVAEVWLDVVPGLKLRPEDTVRTGRNAFAVLRRDDGVRYRIPPETIIDGADLRNIDREELLLLLAVEDMLSVPDRINEDRPVSRTTVLHGSPRGRITEEIGGTDPTTAEFRINGARFLISQNYHGTAVLKIRETLRLFPAGEYRVGAMMIAAESFESMELFEEATRYYRTVLDESADAATRRIAETGLERIRERAE